MLTNTDATMQSASAKTAPPPWILLSWPTVFCQANLTGQPRFIHLSTRIVYSGDHGIPITGQTLWAQHLDDGEAGLAWDWVEVAQGVVAMADPMGVATNLRLLGASGQVLAAHEAAMYICRWVRKIPWQDEVWRALHAA
jgi:hypothetical protein